MSARLEHPLTESATNMRHPASKARRVRELLSDEVIEKFWRWSVEDYGAGVALTSAAVTAPD